MCDIKRRIKIGKIELYTYEEVADILKVSVGTVRNWRSQGLFKPGYKKLGPWKKIALVSEKDVKRLVKLKLRMDV